MLLFLSFSLLLLPWSPLKVKEIDERIKSMIKNQRNCSLVEAALFCAMDCYSTGEGDAKRVKNLEAQIALYQANVNGLKRENEELRSKLRNG